jgi:hypothetical protein
MFIYYINTYPGATLFFGILPTKRCQMKDGNNVCGPPTDAVCFSNSYKSCKILDLTDNSGIPYPCDNNVLVGFDTSLGLKPEEYVVS